MPAMVVLGIDPGSQRCGYGVIALAGARMSRIDSGVIVPGRLPMADRLGVMLERLAALLAEHRVDAVAIESAFCGTSPRSALVLGQARGVAIAVAASAGLPVFEYAPAEVKRAFTGNGRAEKLQMVRTALSLFGIRARLSDEADALAVAFCHLARGRCAATGRSTARATSGRGGMVRRSGVLRPSVRRFTEVPKASKVQELP